MARRRMISPDIWQDPWFGRLTFQEQIFFIGVISNCDDEGRILAEPAFLRSRIFIYQDIPISDISRMIDAFSKTNKNFSYYSVNGNSYIALNTWGKYQKPEHASPSLLPPPPNCSLNGSPNTSENSSVNIVVNDSPPSIVKYSIVKVSNIYSLWNEQKIINHKKMTDDIKRAIETTLIDYAEEDISRAIKNYAEILNGEQYFFKYRWTLKDFLKRGLMKFLDFEIAKQNYLKGRENGTYKQKPGKLTKTYTRPEELLQH